MTRNSLRLRLVAGAAAAIAIALAVAGLALTELFGRHVARGLAGDLEVHLGQILGGIDVDPDARLVLTRPPADPRFAVPLSGLYWQIGDDRGQLLRSRSLWDTTLALPPDDPAAGEVHHHRLSGPAGAQVLVAERMVRLTLGERETPVRAAVAVDLARVAAARAAFAADLVVALAVLAAVLSAATVVQVVLGLRPLDALRRSVAEIRSGRLRHVPEQVPDEVLPLVGEINALIDAREQDLVRSRNRAADLAHGLKTPLAALAADAASLQKKGEIEIAGGIENAIDAMRRHVDRELARARLRGIGPGAAPAATAVAPLVRTLVETVARTNEGERLDYVIEVPDALALPFDRTDLAEALGNLLENATRHAHSRIRVCATAHAISVEDDGPGIPAQARQSVLARGARLDRRGEGAGLGLSIVRDVVEAYGWKLKLRESTLGGLQAVCCAG